MQIAWANPTSKFWNKIWKPVIRNGCCAKDSQFIVFDFFSGYRTNYCEEIIKSDFNQLTGRSSNQKPLLDKSCSTENYKILDPLWKFAIKN